MNDLGSIKVPSWFLDMDIPNGVLTITYFAYRFKK